ncbi:hypothetical protein Bca101_056969 [Brassica carinata]
MAGICELKNMQELDLSRNKLVGEFPSCLTSLTGLRVLDLSSNQMTGMVPSTLSRIKSLEYLSLFDNDFEGLFSFGSLANLSQLKVIKLYSKSNSLQVDLGTSWKPKFELSVIVLRSCKLEKVPHFLLHQKDLHQVDLSDNRISEIFPSWLLANNTKLEVLLLRNNSFTSFHLPHSAHNLLFLDVSVNDFNHRFPDNIGWILPHLRFMNLANNGFQGNLPSSLGNMEKIQFLDISHNNFTGKLPISLIEGCYSLAILKLSHNKLSGEILPKSTNFTDISVLLMDNNHFTGKIGQGLRKLQGLSLLDISNNSVQGVIPNWIGELHFLYVLLISNNLLEGEIPISLFNISSLQMVDLSANTLYGDIPPHVNSTRQVVLFLQDNHLSGAIPDTLLLNVTVLDLRNNSLSGNIPEFTNTQNISILLLRENNLTGLIPHQLCGLSNIHLLDLSNNRLNGSIPSCLSNISFGLRKEDTSKYHDFNFVYIPSDVFTSSNPEQDAGSTRNIGIYFESLLVLDPFSIDYLAGAETKIEFATKYRYDAYKGGNLLNFSGLDLSKNELSGQIPVEVGSLVELHALNLSHNSLSGVIPRSFSGMKKVESLDLSFNSLQGQIPTQLTDLSSLAVFNVSFNNLSGVIPLGQQFNTFDTGSYLGNPLLCGKPTNISCNGNSFQEPDNNGVIADESTIDMLSFYWSCTAAYVIILIGIFTLLSFDSRLSRAWFSIVDAFIHRVRNLLPMDYEAATQTKMQRITDMMPTWVEISDTLFGMDLSENELSGEIPVELGGLLELHALNLSHNYLTGAIPKSFSGMKNMESLDLSFNRLQGHIPPQLTELSSLAVFNVSFNNLSGVIPLGKKFNTFDSQSYLGNPLLFEQPINMSCGSNNFREPNNGMEAEEATIDLVSFYWSFAAAYVTLLLGIFASPSFDSLWSRFWFYITDAFIHKAKIFLL